MVILSFTSIYIKLYLIIIFLNNYSIISFYLDKFYKLKKKFAKTHKFN
jgi:hypothetical protein